MKGMELWVSASSVHMIVLGNIMKMPMPASQHERSRVKFRNSHFPEHLWQLCYKELGILLSERVDWTVTGMVTHHWLEISLTLLYRVVDGKVTLEIIPMFTQFICPKLRICSMLVSLVAIPLMIIYWSRWRHLTQSNEADWDRVFC